MTPECRKSIFSRIGDGLVSGVGVLIVGALGGFVWFEYQDTKDDLLVTGEVLKTANEVFYKLNQTDEKLGDRLDQVQAVVTSLVELAKQDRTDQKQWQNDVETLEVLLGETSSPLGVQGDLDSLIGEQAELLAKLPMSN